MQGNVGTGLQHSSSRVIALGRLLLSTLFLLAIYLDTAQPVHGPTFAYGLLSGYILFAAAITILTWSDWWYDARLAGPAHAVDIIVFTLLVMVTDGQTSPYFAFFMFVMLSAAIRWGWRATTLTAVLLALMYTIAGLLDLSPGERFEPDRFFIGAGHLAILSLILIWFGASQRWPRLAFVDRELDAHPSLDESPLEGGLRAVKSAMRSRRGLIVWRDHGRDIYSGMILGDAEVNAVEVSAADLENSIAREPCLYNLPKGRALWRDRDRNLVAFDPSQRIAPVTVAKLGLKEGLAIPLRSDSGDGMICLEEVRGLSTDHLDAAVQAGVAATAHIQRHRLFRTAEENAEARSRLILARDLHDSVVQFLAGAAFRLEAMKRSNASGRNVDGDLDELKRLMLQEQRELRSFITSLRSGPLTSYHDVTKDLRALAEYLSRQWNVRCEFYAKQADLMMPTRTRLDAHQLMREAVANAVRHAAAKSISIEASAMGRDFRMEIINDGAEFPLRGGRLEMPTSLKDRVDQAGGMLDLARGMGVTKLSISLPIGEANH